MYLLAHVPAARLILEEVQAHLIAKAERYPTMLLPGTTEPKTFDLWMGLHVIDHGTPQVNLNCILCPPGFGRRLRYEFRITTLDDEIIGPVGSSCIFSRALGKRAAQRIGSNLTSQVETYHAQVQKRSQQSRLEAAGNWRSYLREQGFEWVLTAMAGSTELSRELRETLTQLQNLNRPLTQTLHQQLQGLTIKRSAQMSMPPSLPAVASVVGTHTAFQAAPPPLARPRSSKGRPSIGAGERMSSDAWQAYLRHNRLNILLGHWEAIEPALLIQEERRSLIRETIQSRRPFRLEDLNLLQELVKDQSIRAQLEALGRPAAAPQTQKVVRTSQAAPQIMAPEYLNLRGDARLRQAWNWNRGLQAVLPEEVWQRLQRAHDDPVLHVRDYALICQTLERTNNPQLDPQQRTPQNFLTFVALHLGRELKFTRAREVLDASRQSVVLAHLSDFWRRYQQGKFVDVRGLVARALRPWKIVPTAINREPKAGRSVEASLLPASQPGHRETMNELDVSMRVSPEKIHSKEAETRHSTRALPIASKPISTHPSLVSLDLLTLRRLWGRNLSSLIPPTYRKVASQAIHQGNVPLEPEQVRVLQAALLAFGHKESLPACFTVPANEPRSPVRYAVALNRVFDELGLPFLQAALARKGFGWLQEAFPGAFTTYMNRGVVGQDFKKIWLALM